MAVPSNPGSNYAKIMMEVPDSRKYPYDTSLGKAYNVAKYKLKTAAKAKALEVAMRKAYKQGDQKVLDKLTKAAGISGDFSDIVLHYNKAIPTRFGMGELDQALIRKAKKPVKRKLKK